jgi:hypothetical protein
MSTQETLRNLTDEVAARREEVRSMRGWLRFIAYLAPAIVLISLIRPIAMNRALKGSIDVLILMFFLFLSGRASELAARRRLDLKKQATKE